MDFLTLTLELFRNADHFIMYIAQTYGWWVYLVLFMIFYSETGIVICAFLPGDSLLFIAGAAAAAGALNPWLLIVIISLGAILGNTTNFYIGNWLGNKIYDGSISWIDQDALKKRMTSTRNTAAKRLCSPVSCRSSVHLPRWLPVLPR